MNDVTKEFERSLQALESVVQGLRKAAQPLKGVLAALTTLQHLGYTYEGGELWKPPLGPTPKHIRLPEQPDTLQQELEQLKEQTRNHVVALRERVNHLEQRMHHVPDMRPIKAHVPNENPSLKGPGFRPDEPLVYSHEDMRLIRAKDVAPSAQRYPEDAPHPDERKKCPPHLWAASPNSGTGRACKRCGLTVPPPDPANELVDDPVRNPENAELSQLEKAVAHLEDDPT